MIETIKTFFFSVVAVVAAPFQPVQPLVVEQPVIEVQEVAAEVVPEPTIVPEPVDLAPKIEPVLVKETTEEMVILETIPSKVEGTEEKKKCKKSDSKGEKSINELIEECDEDSDKKKGLVSCFIVENAVKTGGESYKIKDTKSFSLNASCSKEADEYEWKVNGTMVGTGSKIDYDDIRKVKGIGAGGKIYKVTLYAKSGSSRAVFSKALSLK